MDANVRLRHVTEAVWGVSLSHGGLRSIHGYQRPLIGPVGRVPHFSQVSGEVGTTPTSAFAHAITRRFRLEIQGRTLARFPTAMTAAVVLRRPVIYTLRRRSAPPDGTITLVISPSDALYLHWENATL